MSPYDLSNAYFDEFETIEFKGPNSSSDLAYRAYNKDQIVLGKKMEDHLRFAVCFWHTVCWPGNDIFGSGTFSHPWFALNDEHQRAAARRQALLWFVHKLDLPFYCFDDVDTGLQTFAGPRALMYRLGAGGGSAPVLMIARQR
jgi:xylose isomerase